MVSTGPVAGRVVVGVGRTRRDAVFAVFLSSHDLAACARTTRWSRNIASRLKMDILNVSKCWTMSYSKYKMAVAAIL